MKDTAYQTILPITFNIYQTVPSKRRVKCTCYNYKNAHWDNLNSDLSGINWDDEFDYHEPEKCMEENLKSILFEKNRCPRSKVSP